MLNYKKEKIMLRVQFGDDSIEVRFDYKFCSPIEIENITGICVNEDRRCSLAKVCLNGGHSIMGMAVCHPNDNFCRAVGRKRALAYSLYPLPKELRTAVWNEYKAVCNL